MGVFLTLASGGAALQDKVRLNLTPHFEAKKASIHFCQGFLAKKDLANQAVQGGISYILGSISQAQKFNSLRGRWFGEKEKKKATVRTGDVIKRGAIVRLSNLDDAPYYLVYVIWQTNRSKWFPTANGEDPLWPIKSSEKKQY